jgi:hypothetical protein
VVDFRRYGNPRLSTAAGTACAGDPPQTAERGFSAETGGLLCSDGMILAGEKRYHGLGNPV